MDDDFSLECIHRYRPLPDGTLQCTECGLCFSRWGQALPLMPRFCTECGAALAPGSSTCLACGTASAEMLRRNELISGPAGIPGGAVEPESAARVARQGGGLPGEAGPPVAEGGFEEIFAGRPMPQPPGAPVPAPVGPGTPMPPPAAPPPGGPPGHPPGTGPVMPPKKSLSDLPLWRWKSILYITIIASTSLSALVVLGMIVSGSFSFSALRVLNVFLAITLYGLLGLCPWSLYERGKYTAFALAALGVIGLALLLSVASSIGSSPASLVRIGSVIAVLAFSCAQSALLLRIEPRHDNLKMVIFVTIGCIAAVALLLIYPIVTDFRVESGYLRFLGVLAVFDFAGSILSPVINGLIGRPKRA